MRLYHVFVFTAPLQAVTVGYSYRGHPFLCFIHVTAHVPAGKIHIDVGRKKTFFTLDGSRPLDDPDVCQFAHWYLGKGAGSSGSKPAHFSRTGGRGGHRHRHQHPFQFIYIVPQFPRIPHIHRIALSSLNRSGQVHSAHSRLNNILHIIHSETEAGNLLAFDIEIEEISRCYPFGIGASGAGNVLHGIFDVFSDSLQFIEAGTQHLYPHGRPDARREHVDPRLDGHGEGIGYSRYGKGVIHLILQGLYGHPLAPLSFRLEIDNRLEHLQRRGIGGRFRPAALAEN